MAGGRIPHIAHAPAHIAKRVPGWMGLAVVLLSLGACVSAETQVCSGGVVCPPGSVCSADGTRCLDFNVNCGNGVVDVGEVCDDGNDVGGDGCRSDCAALEECGNGVVDVLIGETCDDGNLALGDGCSPSCLLENGVWTELDFEPRDLSRVRAIVYDSARGAAVSAGELGEGTQAWRGSFWDPLTSVTPFTLGAGGQLFYSARQGVLAVEGTSHSVWRLSGSIWTKIAQPDTVNQSVQSASAFDTARDVVVRFGGVVIGPPSNATIEWDGEQWVRRSPSTSPPGRSAQAMAYDPSRARTVMFGGRGGTGSLDDTWEWDGGTWHSIVASGPEARKLAKMAFDPSRQAMVLYGGENDAGTPFADTWVWDGEAWTEIAVGQAPDAQSVIDLWFDPERGRMVLATDELWELHDAGWSRVPLSDAPPTGASISSAYDALRGRTVFFGRGPGSAPDELWEWDGRAWQQSTVAGPSSQYAQIAYDATRRETVAFVDGQTWGWDGTAWTQYEPGTSPSAVFGHAMTYDSEQERVLLFGGAATVGGANPIDETWSWDGETWTLIETETSPAPRWDHALAYDPGRSALLLFGGQGLAADTWELQGGRWQLRTPQEEPARRSLLGMAYHADLGQIMLQGGKVSTIQSLSDSWIWDGTRWAQELSSGAVPLGRSGHSINYHATSRAMILAGGIGPEAERSWIYRYQSSAPEESCRTGFDGDGDGDIGCADSDCWAFCTPLCPPAAEVCDSELPSCGDGVCNENLENCRMCPGDCGACTPLCGDYLCDEGESAANCPGDCRQP